MGVAGGAVNKDTVEWQEGDVFLADLDTGLVKLASPREKDTSGLVASSHSPDDQSETIDVIKKESIAEVSQLDPIVEVKGHEDVSDPSVEVKGHEDGVTLRKKPTAQKGVTIQVCIYCNYNTHSRGEASYCEHSESSV